MISREKTEGLAAMLRELADRVESGPPEQFNVDLQAKEAERTPDYENGWWQFESRGLESVRVEITWRP
jgi:hypothetical protein